MTRNTRKHGEGVFVAVVDATPPGLGAGHFAMTVRHIAAAVVQGGFRGAVCMSRHMQALVEDDATDSPHEWPPEGIDLIIAAGSFRSAIDSILEHLQHMPSPPESVVLVFTWMAFVDIDYLQELDSRFVSQRVQWIGLIGLSAALRLPKSPDGMKEQALCQRLERMSACRGLYYWDHLEYLAVSSEQCDVGPLPEYHEATRTEQPVMLAPLRLGFMGSLTAQRGLASFLRLALLNRSVTFTITGSNVPRFDCLIAPSTRRGLPRWQNALIGLVSLLFWEIVTRRRNVVFKQQFFPSQAALNEAIRYNSALYCDSRNNAHSSGIALQSLSCGVPVMWTQANSAISQSLAMYYPAGMLRTKDLWIPGALSRHLAKLPGVPEGLLPGFDQFASAIIHRIERAARTPMT